MQLGVCAGCEPSVVIPSGSSSSGSGPDSSANTGGSSASSGDATGGAPTDAGATDAGATDAGATDAGAVEAEAFDGYAPPFPGEYKPEHGGPCPPCGSFAFCDVDTGWCCSRIGKDGKCTCGDSLGCQPPAVCCALPGAPDYQCVPSAEDCPEIP